MKKLFFTLFFIISILSFAKEYTLGQRENRFTINPETLQIIFQNEKISSGQNRKEVKKIVKNSHSISFIRDNSKISILTNKNIINIMFKPLNENKIVFPIIESANYLLLPLGEGRYIPTNNKIINSYYSNFGKILGDDLSMQVLGASFNSFNATYIIKKLYYNNIELFNNKNMLGLKLTHEALKIDDLNSFSYEIIVSQGDIINKSAKFYKQYLIKNSKFRTLNQKAKNIPNIKKLYGSPFIYLWGDELFGTDNANWKQLQKKIKNDFRKKDNNTTKYFSSLLGSDNIFLRLNRQNYVSNFDKSEWDLALKKLVHSNKLYSNLQFKNINLNLIAKNYIKNGVKNLNEKEMIQFNANLIQSVYSNSTDKVKKWGNGVSTWMVKQLKKSGIKYAWLGIDDASLSLYHPSVISEAVKDGYLIAPYDSYKSLQKTATWSTADFKDKTLYDSAAIKNSDGSYIAGFLNRGRQLNPMLSIPSVKYRLDKYYNQNIRFNSWFVDCDGAGQLNTDYSKNHPMTQSQAAKARNKRLQLIANSYKMVVGTEDGNDYVADSIAYGHGVVTPFIWDKDMRKNKNSKYFMGKYWAPSGIPSIYIKQAPLKKIVKLIYFNPKQNVPLYQLVYNNSVIVSDQWEYSTLKFKKIVTQRLMQSLLWNVPPMFHLDRKVWRKRKNDILGFLKIWAPIHRRLVQTKMSSFSYLTSDKLIQSTHFSDGSIIIANFSNEKYTFNKLVLLPNRVAVRLGKNSEFKFYNFNKYFR